MGLVMARLAVALNGLATGALNAGEAEAALRPSVHLISDPDHILGQGGQPSLRIALARLARLGLGGWAVALVAPGHLGGLRGPGRLTSTALATPPEPEFGAVPVVVAHHGQVALVATTALPLAESLDADEVVILTLARAERPLSPPTPGEAGQELGRAMRTAAMVLTGPGLQAGQRPDPADTIVVGPGYPEHSQALLDQAMTALAIVEAAREGAVELPHAHAITVRANALGPLRVAAMDAVSAALSWPSALMV